MVKGILDQIIERYPENGFMKADGFDSAVIGVEESSMRLIYSAKLCIGILAETMSKEDAI